MSRSSKICEKPPQNVFASVAPELTLVNKYKASGSIVALTRAE